MPSSSSLLLLAVVLLSLAVSSFGFSVVPGFCIPSSQLSATKARSPSPALRRLSSTSSSSSSSSAPAAVALSDLESLKAEESRLLSALSTIRSQKQSALKSRPLRIGVVGFGRFGQFIAKTFTKYGDVTALSRTNYEAEAAKLGVKYLPLERFGELFPPGGGCSLDVLVLSVSILSFEETLSSLLPYLQSESNSLLVVDVLSVKEHPRTLMLESLPPNIDILCTHPMFGPESGKDSWRTLNFVYEKTRVGGVVSTNNEGSDDEGSDDAVAGNKAEKADQGGGGGRGGGGGEVGGSKNRNNVDVVACRDRAERFLSIFEEEGCRMVPLSCESHDLLASNSQFVTHFIGRILSKQGLKPTGIDTKGFESIIKLMGNVGQDSFDLFYGLYKFNANSGDTILKMKVALDEVERALRDKERQDARDEFNRRLPGRLKA